MMQQSTNFDWISDILLTLISRSIDKVDNVQEKNTNRSFAHSVTVLSKKNSESQTKAGNQEKFKKLNFFKILKFSKFKWLMLILGTC